MEVRVLREAGYDEALRGMSYSFKDRALPVDAWWEQQRPKAMKRAEKLANMDGGHNKFLESITVWLDVEAARYWWSEMDTYRVGTTKQSESTMHTLSKRKLTIEDCEYTDKNVDCIQQQVNLFNQYSEGRSIQELKQMLPESYLQRRVVVTNYKVLRNIIAQRYNHRLPEWQQFVKSIYEQVGHPELLPTVGDQIV